MSLRYFAYGSNLKTARLVARVPSAEPVGLGWLLDYRWRCNKRGADGSAKANIEPCPGARVPGVLFAVDAAGFDTLDAYEGGYRRIEVEIERAGTRVAAQTYLSERTLGDERPTAAYRALMLDGAREHGLPASFVAQLVRLAVLGPGDLAGRS